METPRADAISTQQKGYETELEIVREALKSDLNNDDLRYREMILEGKLIQLSRSNSWYEALAEDIKTATPIDIKITIADICPETSRFDHEQFSKQLQTNLQTL